MTLNVKILSFCTVCFAELSIPRLCLTPSNMLVSTYTLRPIVSALTIFQHWELHLISSRLLHPNINCGGEEEAGETRRTEEIRRMTSDGKQVGSYSPNFAKWVDTTIVFSNEQSHGFSTDNHYLSCSRFFKMHKCTCFTFYAAQWMLQGLQCWPGDWILGFHWSLLSRRVEEAPHSPSKFRLRLLSDGIGPFWPLLCEVREDQKWCRLIDLPSSQMLLAVTPIIDWSFCLTQDLLYLTLSWHTLRTVHS